MYKGDFLIFADGRRRAIQIPALLFGPSPKRRTNGPSYPFGRNTESKSRCGRSKSETCKVVCMLRLLGSRILCLCGIVPPWPGNRELIEKGYVRKTLPRRTPAVYTLGFLLPTSCQDPVPVSLVVYLPARHFQIPARNRLRRSGKGTCPCVRCRLRPPHTCPTFRLPANPPADARADFMDVGRRRMPAVCTVH